MTRHPGGRTCRSSIFLAVVMTLWAMLTHPKQTRELWRETK